MSPEIVSKIEYYGQKADIWSLGILLYVMLCGKFPFKGINDTDLFKKIKKGSFGFPESITAEARALIGVLLSPSQKDRPSLTSVKLFVNS
jgi:MAP/microtubule affinity-regulating kinase